MEPGLLTIDELLFLEITNDPSVSPGYEAPTGSFALSHSGKLYLKKSATATDWQDISVAIGHKFDNASNGFTATNVQAAIEEAKASATSNSKARSVYLLVYKAGVANNAWIYYHQDVTNKGILFAVPTVISELSWVNVNTNLSGFVFEFYKNGITANEKVYTYTASSASLISGSAFATGLNVSFAAGDVLHIKYVSSGGTRLNDLALLLYGRCT